MKQGRKQKIAAGDRRVKGQLMPYQQTEIVSIVDTRMIVKLCFNQNLMVL